MELTAVFESWHIGDGNYPPLHRGQLVQLSFELQPKGLLVISDSASSELQHRGDAEYSGRGVVLRRYKGGGETIAVLEAGGLRFYVHGSKAEKLAQGSWVQFEGTLFLDHYLWVEYVHEYADPPDLFYNLRVTRLRKVAIPNRFVHRHARGMSFPTHVRPADWDAVEELETMEDQSFEEEFYVLDFDGRGLEAAKISRTFQ
ncbi:MAG: hypothetical protein HYY64_18510 [Candidatus Rokubacteria bacterium]|nr:hypothetical protein [Candidatus Rokubacteria bacterium]